jgi:hypothetical protein
MRKLEFRTKNLVIHNGIHGSGDGTISDTMLGVRDWIWALWPIHNDKNRGDRVMDIMTEGLRLGTNKWLVTEGYEVLLIGDWKKDDKTGVRYSNDGYKIVSVTPVINIYNRHQLPFVEPQDNAPAVEIIDNFNSNDGIRRVFADDYNSKYMNKEGKWNWIAWTEDYRTHEEARMAVVRAAKEAKEKEETDRASKVGPTEGEEELVSPNLTCAYKDEPVTVMGLVDANGDVDWEGDYEASEDLLLCPHCKNHEYLINPQDMKATQKYPGDTRCGKCGCLFLDDDGQIVGFDLELKKEYNNASSSE